MEIAQMWVSVVADTKDFYSSMGSIEKRMNAAADSSKKLLAGVAAAGAGLLAFGYNAITAGAELQAMEAQFEQVFDILQSDAMDAVNRLSEEFDMLPNRIKPAFTSMTSMFKGLGYDTTDAMKMAEDAVTLAADAAAFYDKSYEDANAALNSFLKGNYEGGEAIGLFANETQMAAYASKESVWTGRTLTRQASSWCAWIMLQPCKKPPELQDRQPGRVTATLTKWGT